MDSPETLDWVFPWPHFDLDWQRAALLVIDVQNYSCNPDGGLAELLTRTRPDVAAYYTARITKTMIPNIEQLQQSFRDHKREIIYTRHGSLLADGRDMIGRRRRRDSEARAGSGRPALWAAGTPEHAIIEQLKPQPNELIIDKNASSPFNGTGIDQILRNLNIETLVLTGTATDMCVETTGRDAADRGYNVVIAEDATTTYFQLHHEASLSAFARVYGQVWTTRAVVKALEEETPASANNSTSVSAQRTGANR